MRDDSRPSDAAVAVAGVDADAFVREVARFRALLADVRVSGSERAHAWDAIVRRAALLDPHEPGFERAGVALKEALCLWLDAKTVPVRR